MCPDPRSLAGIVLVVALASCAEPAASPQSPAKASTPTAASAVASAPAASSAPSARAPEPEPAPEPPAVAGEPLGSPLSNAPTTSAGSAADAAQAISAIRPKLRACYQAARGKGPEIAGMVSCGLRVTKQGKVAAISVTRRDRLPNVLVDCIVKELKTATFAPLEEEVVIQVPVRFAVPGGD